MVARKGMSVMNTFEYKILAGTTPGELEKQLNQLAADGWELASMACSPGGDMTAGCGSIVSLIVLVMRRPKRGGDEAVAATDLRQLPHAV